jgi:succinyl-diaminopimelate desuccinylase
LETLDLGAGRTLTGGRPTLNVGWVQGGMNVNSIPDRARIGLDIRLVPGVTRDDVMAQLAAVGGAEMTFTEENSGPPVYTDPADPWIAEIREIMGAITGERYEAAIATYYTDAGSLTPAYGNPPTIILGPGEMEQAHQTDEFCYVRRIEEARAAYVEIARRWCGV